MSTPDSSGKKAPQFSSFKLAPAPQKTDDCCCEVLTITARKPPQFAAFKPLTTVQNANDCCCDGACSSTPTLSENVSGTRYSWKVQRHGLRRLCAQSRKMPCASLQA